MASKREKEDRYLEDGIDDAPPRGPRLTDLPLLVDVIPVELAAVGIDVDLIEREPARALPCEADGPEEEHDGDGQARVEKALGPLGRRGMIRVGDRRIYLRRRSPSAVVVEARKKKSY